MFGNNKPFGTATAFRGGFQTTTPTGTTLKFIPPTGTDTMMKGGVSTSIGTRHQCITCMKEYENKSLEELRVEDYAANRKGGTAGGITFGGATQQTGGLFGSTAAASTSGFSFGNTTQSKPLFGTTGTTNAFGSTNLFGQPAQNQNTGLFGKSVGFGAATTAAPVFNFGGTSTMGTGTSLFGQNNQQKPLFGQTTSAPGLFGNTATTQSTGFGTTTGFGAFGATNQQSKAMCQLKKVAEEHLNFTLGAYKEKLEHLKKMLDEITLLWAALGAPTTDDIQTKLELSESLIQRSEAYLQLCTSHQSCVPIESTAESCLLIISLLEQLRPLVEEAQDILVKCQWDLNKAIVEARNQPLRTTRKRGYTGSFITQSPAGTNMPNQRSMVNTSQNANDSKKIPEEMVLDSSDDDEEINGNASQKSSSSRTNNAPPQKRVRRLISTYSEDEASASVTKSTVAANYQTQQLTVSSVQQKSAAPVQQKSATPIQQKTAAVDQKLVSSVQPKLVSPKQAATVQTSLSNNSSVEKTINVPQSLSIKPVSTNSSTTNNDKPAASAMPALPKDLVITLVGGMDNKKPEKEGSPANAHLVRIKPSSGVSGASSVQSATATVTSTAIMNNTNSNKAYTIPKTKGVSITPVNKVNIIPRTLSNIVGASKEPPVKEKSPGTSTEDQSSSDTKSQMEKQTDKKDIKDKGSKDLENFEESNDADESQPPEAAKSFEKHKRKNSNKFEKIRKHNSGKRKRFNDDDDEEYGNEDIYDSEDSDCEENLTSATKCIDLVSQVSSVEHEAAQAQDPRMDCEAGQVQECSVHPNAVQGQKSSVHPEPAREHSNIQQALDRVMCNTRGSMSVQATATSVSVQATPAGVCFQATSTSVHVQVTSENVPVHTTSLNMPEHATSAVVPAQGTFRFHQMGHTSTLHPMGQPYQYVVRGRNYRFPYESLLPPEFYNRN